MGRRGVRERVGRRGLQRVGRWGVRKRVGGGGGDGGLERECWGWKERKSVTSSIFAHLTAFFKGKRVMRGNVTKRV